MSKLQWDRDFALEQAADDIELLEELIEIFKDSCASDLEAIKKGIAAENAEMICAGAHSVKGASASLGIIGVRDVATEIETDSRNGSTGVAIRRIEELDELLQLVQQL